MEDEPAERKRVAWRQFSSEKAPLAEPRKSFMEIVKRFNKANNLVVGRFCKAYRRGRASTMTVGRCIACADCGTSGGKQFRYEYVESGNEYSLLVESAGDCSGKPRIRRKGEKPKEATEKPKEATVQELADIDRVIDGLRRKEEKILPSTVGKELASTSGGKPFGMDAKKFRQACWRRKVKIFGKSRSKKHTPLTWSHDWKRYVESRQERVGVVWMEEIAGCPRYLQIIFKSFVGGLDLQAVSLHQPTCFLIISFSEHPA